MLRRAPSRANRFEPSSELSSLTCAFTLIGKRAIRRCINGSSRGEYEYYLSSENLLVFLSTLNDWRWGNPSRPRRHTQSGKSAAGASQVGERIVHWILPHSHIAG